MFAQSVAPAVAHTNHKLMKDVARVASHERHFDLLGQSRVGEHQFILLSFALSPGRPFFEMGQLRTQHRGLQCIEPAVNSDDFVMVFRLFAMHAQHVQAPRVIQIVCGQHSAIARAAQIL